MELMFSAEKSYLCLYFQRFVNILSRFKYQRPYKIVELYFKDVPLHITALNSLSADVNFRLFKNSSLKLRFFHSRWWFLIMLILQA